MSFDWNKPAVPWPLPSLQDASLCEAEHSPGLSPLTETTRWELAQLALRLPLTSLDLGEAGPLLKGLLNSLPPDSRLACTAQGLTYLSQLKDWAGTRPLEVLLRPSRPLARNPAAMEEWEAGCRVLRGSGVQVTLLVEGAGSLHPTTLARVLQLAGRWRCRGVVLWDHSGGRGVTSLVRFCRHSLVRPLELTWGSANRDGLALAGALEAAEAGVDRIRASALGLGPQGCPPLELLLYNLRLLGRLQHSLQDLPSYCRKLAEGLGMAVPAGYPMLGSDAFRQASAQTRESALPPAWFGVRPRREVGPLAGPGCVVDWLQRRGHQSSPERVASILQRARSSRSVLGDMEMEDMLRSSSGHEKT